MGDAVSQRVYMKPVLLTHTILSEDRFLFINVQLKTGSERRGSSGRFDIRSPVETVKNVRNGLNNREKGHFG
jgi:hypothetical protein